MGSYAHITVDGFPIESSKNYFHQWFFRKSERRIVNAKKSARNPLVWGAPDADDADELESNYVFEAKAAVLKRRLELSGATRSALELEFKEGQQTS